MRKGVRRDNQPAEKNIGDDTVLAAIGRKVPIPSEISSFHRAVEIFFEVAKGCTVSGDPREIFSHYENRVRVGTNDEAIWECIEKAKEEGLPELQIIEAFFALRYTSRRYGLCTIVNDTTEITPETWKNVSHGQAGTICHLNSAKVPIFDYLEGGIPDVEDMMLLNGIFGLRGIVISEEDLERIWDYAATKYMLDQCLEHGLPLPPYILFASKFDLKSKHFSDFGRVAELALKRMEKFAKEAQGASMQISSENVLWFSDKTRKVDTEHDRVAQVALNMVIFSFSEGDYNGQQIHAGKLYVVKRTRDSIKIREFSDWASDDETFCRVLPANREDAAGIRKIAEGYLGLEKEGSRILWKDVVEEYGAAKAEKIWRAKKLLSHAENAMKFSPDEKKLELRKFMSRYLKFGCVDGREPIESGFKDYGSEFPKWMLLKPTIYEENLKLLIARHMGCGYLGTCIKIHNTFKELKKFARGLGVRSADLDVRVRAKDRMMFFKDAIGMVLEGGRGAVTSKEIFDKIAEIVPGSPEEREKNPMYQFFYELFVSDNEKVRDTVRHAKEHGVLEVDRRGLVSMPAAAWLDLELKNYGIESIEQLKEHGIADPERMANLLITEEHTRRAMGKEGEWLDGERIAVEWEIEHYHSGKATAVPSRPTTLAELLNTTRTDFWLSKLHQGVLGTFGIDGAEIDVLASVV